MLEAEGKEKEIYFICDISVQQNDSSLFFDVTWQTQTRKPLKIEKGLQRTDLPAELLESDFFPQTNLVGQKVYIYVYACVDSLLPIPGTVWYVFYQ